MDSVQAMKGAIAKAPKATLRSLCILRGVHAPSTCRVGELRTRLFSSYKDAPAVDDSTLVEQVLKEKGSGMALVNLTYQANFKPVDVADQKTSYAEAGRGPCRGGPEQAFAFEILSACVVNATGCFLEKEKLSGGDRVPVTTLMHNFLASKSNPDKYNKIYGENMSICL